LILLNQSLGESLRCETESEYKHENTQSIIENNRGKKGIKKRKKRKEQEKKKKKKERK
jgi:hypothetical protein